MRCECVPSCLDPAITALFAALFVEYGPRLASLSVISLRELGGP